jgi:hypothetical protein
MTVLYVLAANVAGVGLAFLAFAWGGSLLGAFLVYWLTCTVVAVLTAFVCLKFTARSEQDAELHDRRSVARKLPRARRVLRPVRATD